MEHYRANAELKVSAKVTMLFWAKNWHHLAASISCVCAAVVVVVVVVLPFYLLPVAQFKLHWSGVQKSAMVHKRYSKHKALVRDLSIMEKIIEARKRKWSIDKRLLEREAFQESLDSSPVANEVFFTRTLSFPISLSLLFVPLFLPINEYIQMDYSKFTKICQTLSKA